MNPQMERKTIKVNIYNQPYTLMVAGEPDEVESLAASVDELMTEIGQKSGNIDSGRVAVLACLHLADRLREIEDDLEELRTRVAEKSREFSLLLDAAIR